MFLENGLTMPHTSGRVRYRNKEEDIRQVMIQSPQKSLEFLDDTCGRDGPIPWPMNSSDLMPPGFSCGGTSSHLCTDKDHRMKLTSDRRSPRPLHRSLRKFWVPRGATSPRGMKYATSAVVVMSSVNVLMCWGTKVVSLLQVYVPLTGNEVDSFPQRFHFFL
jgi:hypothetical protein